MHRPGDAQPSGEAIRVLRHSDLDRAEQLSRQVGFNQTAADWARLLDLGPDSCFAAVREDGIVATTTVTAYASRLAWIGMVVVDESARRRGIAGRLVGHALRHLESVDVVGLDATPGGKQVYDAFGFVDQYTIHRLQGVAVPVDTSELAGARPMTLADLPDVVGMDAATLGVARSPLIRSLFEAGPAAGWVVEDDAGLAAWSFRRPGAKRWHIGPVAARHDDGAELAVRAASAAIPGAPIEMDAVDGPRCAHLADRFQLAVARSFVRMARGGSLPDPARSACYATAAPELG